MLTPAGFVKYFGVLGLPKWFAYAIIAFEILGGAALIIGVLVRWIAVLFAGELAGTIVMVGSTAGLISYEGGASYTAAKHGVHTLAETLRLEIVGEPVRVIEIAPGMVRTEEFSRNRMGSQDAADSVYRGVREPLVAEDIADCITWTVTRPHHVNIDLMVVRPLAQAAQHKVFREE